MVPDPPLEYDVAVMTSPTHLALVADLTGAPVSEIQALNPALLKNIAPAGYQVNVPHGTANTLIASLQTVPPARRAAWRIHRVESGETLASIGKRYGAQPSAIAAANRLESEAPEAGDRLVIPQAAAVPTALRKPQPRPAVRRAATTTSARKAVPSATSKPKPKTGAVAKAGRKKAGSVGGA